MTMDEDKDPFLKSGRSDVSQVKKSYFTFYIRPNSPAYSISDWHFSLNIAFFDLYQRRHHHVCGLMHLVSLRCYTLQIYF